MTVTSAAVTGVRESQSESFTTRALRLYSKIVCASVLGLIFFGALVTSHNAGLSVPDWPTTYGQNMFSFPVAMWQGGILFEHGHRLLASMVGFLILTLAAAVALTKQTKLVRRLSGATLFVVLTQGALGGLTVLLKLPDAVSILHGMLGQTLFLLTIAIAFFLSKGFAEDRAGLEFKQNIFSWAVVGIVLMYLQLFLGALTRHSESGIAIPDFPTMGGSFIPWANEQMLQASNSLRAGLGLSAITLGQVEIHLMHRVGALVLTVFTVYFAFLLGRAELEIKRPPLFAALIAFILVTQVCLGILTVLSVRDPLLTSLHVFTGAAFLGSYFLIALRSYQVTPI